MMRFFSSSDSTASLTTSIPTKRTEKVKSAQYRRRSNP